RNPSTRNSCGDIQWPDSSVDGHPHGDEGEEHGQHHGDEHPDVLHQGGVARVVEAQGLEGALEAVQQVEGQHGHHHYVEGHVPALSEGGGHHGVEVLVAVGVHADVAPMHLVPEAAHVDHDEH